ncbi:MAG: tRNA (adenine-N1)-methyltransferase [Chloroflexota bacterium]
MQPDPQHDDPRACAQEGDLAQLVSPNNKVSIIRLESGGKFESHRGILPHDDLIGQPWGSQVFSHLGSAYFLLRPSLSDLLKEIRRNTQIMYPKEIGYVLVTMGIGPGKHVLEAGTGSGALTTALAWAVGPQGHVTSYDVRQEMQNLARKNLGSVGLAERVTFKLRDIAEGFDERNVDALFLDVPNPYDYLEQVRQALVPGGYFGCILPTTNQVSRLLQAFYPYGYAFIEVCEIMLRYYKPVPERLRPTDRMVAHTGYLIFARPMLLAKERPADAPLPFEAPLGEDESGEEKAFDDRSGE